MSAESYAVVAGGINIDIGGKPFLPMIPGDSNPGRVDTALGGVGRNIAHVLSLLGSKVRFLTAFGDDAYAFRIEASCAELGIDISRALKVKGGITPIYLYLNDSGGDMLMAVSDMALCDSIGPDYLSSNADIISGAGVTAADTNIPKESLEWLADNCGCPLFVDPVSVKKAEKLKGILGKIHTLKANIMEAEFLSGISIKDRKSLESAMRALLETGLERVFITLGKSGAAAAGCGEIIYAPAFPADVRCTTGAGDAFMASLVHSYLNGADTEEALRLASAAASFAVESAETVNSAITAEAVLERAILCSTERFDL